jgi:hypothetical protein
MRRSRLKLVDMLRNDRYDLLAARLESQFGVPVDQDKLSRACFMPSGHFDGSWSEDSVMSWLKIRLLELGAFVAGKNYPAEVSLLTTMHVFFIALEETEEMLANLRHELAEVKSSVARSKIFSTNKRVLEPIDRVAARVTVSKEA